MKAASRVWPYYTPWTLADVKTAAWLVEKGHLTQLERFMLSSDLHTFSVSSALETIRRVASVDLSKTDEGILNKTQGQGFYSQHLEAKLIYKGPFSADNVILCWVGRWN